VSRTSWSQSIYAHYRRSCKAATRNWTPLRPDLVGWYDRPPFAAQVARLSAYRGVTQLGALTLAAEVGDWRRFASYNPRLWTGREDVSAAYLPG
jgi:hypothetical protein